MNYNELKTKSLSDDNFAKQMSYKLNDSDERASFFTWISSLGSHWQENPTPFEIIRKMVSKTSLNDKHILVLFNIEFLHILIDEQGVNPQDITFIADNHIEKLSANKIFKVQSYKISDFTVPALKKFIIGLDMKFDLVFSNPPYNSNIDIKILNEINNISNEFIIVHPSTWVLDIKGKTKLYTDYLKKIDSHVKSLEFFNGNPVFNIGLFVPCVITHINNNCETPCEVNYFDDVFEANQLSDVTKFGSNWKTHLQPFIKKINFHIASSQSIWDMKMNPDNRVISQDKFYVQLAAIRGHVNLSSKNKHIVQDDFYTMVMQDSDNNKGVRKPNSRNDGFIVFEFSTEIQQDNFIKYLKTDFARFCLAIVKNKADLHYGEMSLIPWLDFTEEWDDDKLFKKFDVSQELQDYIRDFLPDYYSIRK